MAMAPVSMFPVSPPLSVRFPQAPPPSPLQSTVTSAVASAVLPNGVLGGTMASLPSNADRQSCLSPTASAKRLDSSPQQPVRLISSVSTAPSRFTSCASVQSCVLGGYPSKPFTASLPSPQSAGGDANTEAAISQLRAEVGGLRDDLRGVRAAIDEELRRHTGRSEGKGDLRTTIDWLFEELAVRDREAQELREELQRRGLQRSPEDGALPASPLLKREVARSASSPVPNIARHRSLKSTYGDINSVPLAAVQETTGPFRLDTAQVPLVATQTMAANGNIVNLATSRCSSPVLSRVNGNNDHAQSFLQYHRNPDAPQRVSLGGTPRQVSRTALLGPQPTPSISSATSSVSNLVNRSGVEAGSPIFQQAILEDGQDVGQRGMASERSLQSSAGVFPLEGEALRTKVSAQLREMVSARSVEQRSNKYGSMPLVMATAIENGEEENRLAGRSSPKRRYAGAPKSPPRYTRPERKPVPAKIAPSPPPQLEGKPVLCHQPGAWSPGRGTWSPSRPSSKPKRRMSRSFPAAG